MQSGTNGTSSNSQPVSDFRIFLFDCLNVWYRLLDYWAGKGLHKVISSDSKESKSRSLFLQRNEKIQREMAEIFAPYQPLCRECTYCCRIDLPLYQVDCVLYGFKPYSCMTVPATRLVDPVRRMAIWLKPKQIWKVLKSLRRGVPAQRNMKPFFKNTTRQPCWMWIESGCKYEWGERPTFCVLYLCENLISHMSSEDYRKYFWTSCKYLRHLTLALKEAMA
jgi:hypothetical protein